jgi:hypothetical protein
MVCVHTTHAALVLELGGSHEEPVYEMSPDTLRLS